MLLLDECPIEIGRLGICTVGNMGDEYYFITRELEGALRNLGELK